MSRLNNMSNDAVSNPSSTSDSEGSGSMDSSYPPSTTYTGVNIEPLSAEDLVRSYYWIFWEAAQNMLAGAIAFRAIPEEWREAMEDVFHPYSLKIESHEISPEYRTLYTESMQHMTHFRRGDNTPTSLPTPTDINQVEVSLQVAMASQGLRNKLNTLPEWIELCYLPLLQSAFSSNDIIGDVTLDLPVPPGERLCEDVFDYQSLIALRTDTVNVPIALRLSKESLRREVPSLPPALASISPSQLSPQYFDPDEPEDSELELFSTLVVWHPYHLGVQYTTGPKLSSGLWRHSRMAASSPTRHLQWLGIHAPVIVVEFDFEMVSFYLSWPQLIKEDYRCTSALVWTPDLSQRTWNLRNPAEAIEVGLILANIDRYTSGYYLKQVGRRFGEGDSFHLSSRPWKIDASTLPMSMTEVEGSAEWREEQELLAERNKIAESPPDISEWLKGVC